MKPKSASLFTVHTSHSVAAVTDTGMRFSVPKRKAEAKSMGALRTSMAKSRPSCTISVLAVPAVSKSAERHSATLGMMRFARRIALEAVGRLRQPSAQLFDRGLGKNKEIEQIVHCSLILSA